MLILFSLATSLQAGDNNLCYIMLTPKYQGGAAPIFQRGRLCRWQRCDWLYLVVKLFIIRGRSAYMCKKKLPLRFLFLTALFVGAILFGTMHLVLAAHPSVNAQDWNISAGIDPWGTAFDSQGNVWVAVPGCDPNPNCPSGTPPGMIEEFNPATSSWI